MRPELLAPAGGFDQLSTALHFGADAVYLGGTHFGLRKRATNFDDEDIAKAVALSHAVGVKVHVTVNTLLHESDLGEIVEYLHLVNDAGADAIIATDLATISLAQKEVPSLEVHASTQLSCANSASALVLCDLGCKRIVLARELTLAEIAQIRAHTPEDLELEVFAHGAMCMAYSGRCIISNYLKGKNRDGNRGFCAQPCRWEYTLEERQRPGVHIPIVEDGRATSILSSKDLCMIEHLDDLAEVGVDSLKIEGRGKSSYYVATVVNAYRHVLDGADVSEYLPELEKVSHRPYHTGFFYGDPDQTADVDEYEATHLMCGVVTACRKAGMEDASCYRVTFEVRNRIEAGQTIEVLSPSVGNRSFVFEHAHNENAGETTVVNRVCEAYEFDCPFEMAPGDILRRERQQGEERLRALRANPARCGSPQKA